MQVSGRIADWAVGISRPSCHCQVFNAVFDRQLGATRPVAPLTETERTRLRELVELHAPRLRKVQFTSLEDKLQVGISFSLRWVLPFLLHTSKCSCTACRPKCQQNACHVCMQPSRSCAGCMLQHAGHPSDSVSQDQTQLPWGASSCRTAPSGFASSSVLTQ